MTATFDFDRLLGSVLEAGGPADVPASFVDAALARARDVDQRRPVLAALDRRAWPARRWVGGVTTSRLAAVAVAALLVVAIVAALVVGGRVVRPTKPPDILGSFDGVIESIGTLSGAREEPTLVTLEDGRVLMVGGAGQNVSAEIIDPTTGRTTPVGIDEPDGPTKAIRLLDGRVLILGWTYGEPASTGRPDVRVFDPVSNAFSPVGPMVAPRFEPSVLLLRDGRVLISGGLVNQESVRVLSAELFDPTTNTFAPSGWDGDWRFATSTIQLDDGRILLVTGCLPDGDPGATTCTYPTNRLVTLDPSSGRWSIVGSMSQTRRSADALHLDAGRILIFNRGERPDVQRFGRHGVDPVSTDIFDPTTDAITAGPTLPHAVTLTAPLSDGRVFLAGHWSLARSLATRPPSAAPDDGSNADYIEDWWIGLFDPSTGESITSLDPIGGGSRRIADIHMTHANAAVLPDDRVIFVSGDNIEVFH